MKKLFFFGLFCVLGLFAFAEDADKLNITVKQGFIVNLSDSKLNNLTTIETVRTKPIESWGKWNALWDGWSLDAGAAYDAQSSGIDDVALLLGRNFGTLGKYLPLDFPLKDKITVTMYPIGLYIKNVQDGDREFDPCIGGAILRLDIIW